MAKNYIVLSVLYLIGLLASFSLKAQSDYDIYNYFRENTNKYVGVHEESKYHLHNKKDNPACSIKVDFFYPEKTFTLNNYEKIQSLFVAGFFGEEYKDIAPKEAAKNYMKNYVDSYKDDLEDLNSYNEERKDAVARGWLPEEINYLYTYEKTMRNTIMFNKGNIVSQVINIYEYTGGAHGASFTQGLVIDLHVGSRIEFDDVFVAGATRPLSDLLLAKLLLAKNLPDKEALYEVGFYFDEFPLTDNFIVDDKGVTFIYGQYELGAYSLGIVEIFVPYWELVPYMKRTSAIAKLVRIDKMEL